MVKLDRERIKTGVWAFVAVYALLSVYAAIAGSALADVATDVLFGVFVAAFGTLLLARARVPKLIVAGGLLALGGGLGVVAAVISIPGLVADLPILVGFGLYAYERWVRRGTEKSDPLAPKYD